MGFNSAIKKTVLVTGASGFIGRQILPLLMTKGYEVHGVARNPFSSENGVVWHKADLLNRDDLNAVVDRVKPSHVVHLAWEARPGIFWNSSDNELWKTASIQLLQRAIDNGCQHFIGAGSCAEYDWNRTDRNLWCETDACAPATLYGQCKLACLHELEKIAHDANIRFAWGRVFLPFGENEPAAKLISSVIASLKAGTPAKCSTGDQIRDFIDVKDVAQAFAALCDLQVSGVVNIGSGQAASIAEVVTFLGNLANKPELIQLGALPDRANEPPFMVANVDRLRNELNVHPNNIWDSLNQTFTYFDSSFKLSGSKI